MPTETNRAIGSLDFTIKERRNLARKSRFWTCDTCGPIENLLKNPTENHVTLTDPKEQKNDTSRDNKQMRRKLGDSRLASVKQTKDYANIQECTSRQKTDRYSDDSNNTTIEGLQVRNTSSHNNDLTNELRRQPESQTYPQCNDNQGKVRQENHEVEPTPILDDASSEQQLQPRQQRRRTGVDELARSKRNFLLKSTFVLLLILLLRRIFMIALVA